MPKQADISKTPRILICEDETLLTKDLEKSLIRLGYEIIGGVSSGEEAVKLAEESVPDLILIDIKLRGEKDGVEAADKIRSRFGIPVVYLTGFAENDVLERAKRTEPYGYLSKPVGLLELRSTIETALYKHQVDKSIRESELWMNSVFDALEESIVTVTPERVVRDINPATERMFGYGKEEVIGRTTEIFHVDLAHYVEFGKRMSEAFDKRTSAEFEFELKRKNGEIFPSHHTVSLLKDRDGEPLGIASVVRDITERRKTEEAMLNSERFLQATLDALSSNIAILDEQGSIISVNKSWRKFETDNGTHLPNSGIGLNYLEICDSATGYRSEGAATVARMIREVIEGTSLDFDWEYPCHSPSEKRWFVLRASRFLMGTKVHVALAHENITARREAEESLLESERKFRLLTETIDDVFWMSTPGVREMVYISPAYEKIWGRTLKSLYRSPHSFLEAVHPDDRELLQRIILGSHSKGERYTCEYRILPANGTVVRIHERGFPIYDDQGRLVLMCGLCTDISERKEMEKRLIEAQKMEAVGTLAGGIAHDFNNLLHVIAGYAELLESELAQKGLRFSETDAIRQSVERGADLVRQILTYSRKVESKLEVINLNEDIKNIERLLYRTIPKMINIKLKLEDELKQTQADSAQIKQILLNLAVNAKDAMPKGGKLTVKTQNVTVEKLFCEGCHEHFSGQYVLLTISDTGHGMSEEVVKHVFDPFFTTKGFAEGTGLGLPTVLGIVKLHGGHINCESEIGKGTTFSIYFPVAETNKPYVEAELEYTQVSGGDETILVVDDEQLIADLAKRILENAGYSVIKASSGNEALEIYSQRNTDIDLVILDLIMPEMGGEQCLKELLKINPEVKALIASGFDIKGETKTFLDFEAYSRVAKPFKMRDLLRSVRYVLDGP